MPQASFKFHFTREELDALTDSLSDKEIAVKCGLPYPYVWRERNAYQIRTFTQKTGLIKIAKTGELRRKGSVRGVVRSDGLLVDYFTEIDTPDKAYWLGMLLADGWVTCRGGVPKEVGLACHPRDEAILADFRAAVNSSARIVHKINKRSLSKSGVSRIATIRITCQAFTAYTMAAGIEERKSGKAKIPDGAHLFPASFVRGYLDGDGGIGKRNFAIICNSVEFAKELQLLIAANTGTVLRLSTPLSPRTGKPVARLTGYRGDRSLLHWLYLNGDGPMLARKRAKVIESWS